MVLCIAALPAVVYVSTFDVPPEGDAGVYWRLGCQIKDTGHYGTPGHPEGYWPPGNPYYIASVIRLAGRSPRSVVFCNLILFIFILALTGAIATRVFGPRVGMISMLLAGWTWDLFNLAGLLMTEIPYIFLVLSWAALVVLPPREKRRTAWALAGFLLGLSTLVRGTSLLLLPFLAIGVLIWPTFPWRRKGRLLLQLTWMALFFFVPVGQWEIRNYNAFGFLFPVSLNSGENLAYGNNSFGSVEFPGPDAPMRKALGLNTRDPVQMYRNGRSAFFAELKRHPIQSTLRCAPRLWITLTDQWPAFANPHLTSHPLTAYYLRYSLLWLWGVCLALGTAGLLLGARLRDPRQLLILGFGLYWLDLHAWMESHPRYKVPLIPFVAMYTSVFVEHLIVQRQRGEKTLHRIRARRLIRRQPERIAARKSVAIGLMIDKTGHLQEGRDTSSVPREAQKTTTLSPVSSPDLPAPPHGP